MEEEKSKITTTANTEKGKDPRRVELGKRLGAISKKQRNVRQGSNNVNH